MALDREVLAAHVSRTVESSVGIAAHAAEREREVAACSFEQQDVVFSGGGAVHDRGEGLDVERDGVERILGGAGAFGQHDRDRLPDIADLAVGNDGLLERLERRRGFLPQRNPRNGGADVGRGDDGVDAGAGAGGRGRDAADAPVRDRAAQDHRVEKIVASEVVDELAAPAEEAKILDPFDRAADKGIACALSALHAHQLPCQAWGESCRCRYILGRDRQRRARDLRARRVRQSDLPARPAAALICLTAHITIVAWRLSSARATLSAARAEVLGLVREALPCSWMAKLPATPSASIS